MHKFSKKAICISILLLCGIGNAVSGGTQGSQSSGKSEVTNILLSYEHFKIELDLLYRNQAIAEENLIVEHNNQMNEVVNNRDLRSEQLSVKQQLERIALDQEFANQEGLKDVYLAKKDQLIIKQSLETNAFNEEQAMRISILINDQNNQISNLKIEFKIKLRNLSKAYGYVEGEFINHDEPIILDVPDDRKPEVTIDYIPDPNDPIITIDYIPDPNDPNANNGGSSSGPSLHEDRNTKNLNNNKEQETPKAISGCNTGLHLSLFAGEFWCTKDPYPCGGYYLGLSTTDFTQTASGSCLTEASIRPGGVYAVNNEENEKIFTFTEDISEPNCMTELHSVNVKDVRGSLVASYQFIHSINKCPPPPVDPLGGGGGGGGGAGCWRLTGSNCTMINPAEQVCSNIFYENVCP